MEQIIIGNGGSLDAGTGYGYEGRHGWSGLRDLPNVAGTN